MSSYKLTLRAERRIGEFSLELPKEQGGTTRFGSPHDGENQTKLYILKDAGINHHERYEIIANLTIEMANELWIANKVLSKPGSRTDLDENSSRFTWSGYCEAIGIHYTTADNWLARWFPEEYGGVENAMAWLYISTPFWTVGIEVDHMLVVTTTPPVAKWMIGRGFDKVIEKIQNEYSDVIIRELR